METIPLVVAIGAALWPLIVLIRQWSRRTTASKTVKLRVKVGGKTADIEYDPSNTTAADLEKLIKALTSSRSTSGEANDEPFKQ